ncbi:MAG: histidine phosphatase family protein [Ignavibacteriaceae bacterium]|nr:histidine phosphatase family protein [Ignavibacteriaceae bacterium]NUM71559.1 histidine phosphatase family protein [Ignavibacteriaceae bacterium]
MKRLIFLRHAKSSWDYPLLEDFERPLNERGRADAPVMAQLMKENNLKPSLIISSFANRAAATAVTIARGIGYHEENIIFEALIYFGHSDDIITFLSSESNTYETLMIVGHNPELTICVNKLCGEGVDDIPTCGIVVLESEINNWNETDTAEWKLVLFDSAKKYRNRQK